ncbi:DNA polymerase III subunit [Agarivorans sp. QJM3NY_33]|uniref:DNA polymerase III subunit n=1 Tax=Agarivorans sp. QJM3NY_33 TaxID=3421432 RepID=UPI003D7C7E01
MSLPWLGPIWKQLASQLQQQHFPQSILLRGEKGLGKQQMAQFLAKTLLCTEQTHQACNACHSCQVFEANNHGGLYQVNQDKPKLDDVRALSAWAGQTSHLGPHKVAIIHDISSLNDASNNALLKTLEEPVDGTFFILINHLPFKAMPTIRSRCQSFNLPTPPLELVKTWLVKQKIRLDENFLLIHRFCNGAPLIMAEFYRQQSLKDLQLFLTQYQQMVHGQTHKLGDIIQKQPAQLSWLGHTLALSSSIRGGLLNQALFPQLPVKQLSASTLNKAYQDWLLLVKQLESFPSLNLGQQLYPLFNRFKEPVSC